MELRPIPFVDDARYRIAEDGTVWAVVPPRKSKRIRLPRPEPRTPMTLDEAAQLARKQLANTYFPLIDPDDGAVHHLCHRGRVPPGEARLVGTEFAPVGDTRSGWYSINTADGTVHLFHGPSVASAVFRRRLS